MEDPEPEPGRPEVSVIMTAWNAAATVERALRSALDECDVPIECVVVDDGSTDATAAVVDRLARADERVRLIRLPANEGVSGARNHGLDAARGEWLAFLDADDRLTPGAIARLHATAVRTGALAVIGQRVWTDGTQTWIGRNYDNADVRTPGRKSLATNVGLVYYLSTTSKLFHRSLVEGLRFEGRVLGDQPWTAAALLRAGDRVEVIGDVVYEWIRPPKGEGVMTITSAKAATIEASVAVAVVARTALRRVAEEAGRAVADPARRDALVAAYAERLMRDDLGKLVTRWSARGGEEPGRLFRAVGAFLELVPWPVLARSRAFREMILLPPLRRWSRLAWPARLGFGSILRAYRPVRSPAARRSRRTRLRLAAWAGRRRRRELRESIAVRLL